MDVTRQITVVVPAACQGALPTLAPVVRAVVVFLACFMLGVAAARSQTPSASQPASQVSATTRPADTAPASASATPASKPATFGQEAEIRRLVDQLWQANLDAEQRRQVASSLLRTGSAAARAAILAQLDVAIEQASQPATQPAMHTLVQQAIAQAIAAAAGDPSAVLAPALLDLLARSDDPLQSDLAMALSRFTDAATRAAIQAAATDRAAAPRSRRGAMVCLSYQHTQQPAGTLIGLLDDGQPPALREVAASALAQVTGITDFGADAARWRSWWEQSSGLSSEAWFTQIIANHARGRELALREATQLRDQLVPRLVDAQRQLYRAAPKSEQQAVLVAMLADPLDPMRQAAVELAVQRISDEPRDSIVPELRAALRARLGDPLPMVRQRATVVLSALNDGPAADKVGQILSSGQESSIELLRQYLLMMDRLPRSGAIPAALVLLSNPALRGEAAGALASAADAHLLDHTQAASALKILNDQLRDRAEPEPQVVALWSRVGPESRWDRIAGWLDSPHDAVAKAAAQAWVQFDKPLLPLAQRISNQTILPILLDAAAKQGKDPAVFLLVIGAKPQQEAVTEAWRHALIAMAPQMPPEIILEADHRLAQRNEPATFRDQILSPAIDKLLPPAVTQPAVGNVPPVAADLLLARAEIRATDNDPKQTLADCQRLADLKLVLSPAQKLRYGELTIAARLAISDMTGLFDFTRKLVDDGAHSTAPPLPLPIFVIFLTSAERGLSANQLQKAGDILDFLHSLTLPPLPDKLQERLAQLERQVGRHNPPPSPDQDLPSSETQPAATTQVARPTP